MPGTRRPVWLRQISVGRNCEELRSKRSRAVGPSTLQVTGKSGFSPPSDKVLLQGSECYSDPVTSLWV